MRSTTLTWLTALALPFFAARAAAQVRTFQIERGGQVEFVSDASLERIVGVSSGTGGSLSVDPKHPEQTRGSVHVDVASLRTGVALRDEHLRGDGWLDGGRFPRIELTITQVSGLSELTPNSALEPTVTGKLSVHGVTRELTTKARVRYVPASAAGERDSLRVQASFVVHLKDHGVSIPAIVALKVSPDIQVKVDVRATAEPPAAPVPVVQAPVLPDAAPAAPVEKPAPKARPVAAAKPAKPASAAQPRAPATPAATPEPAVEAASVDAREELRSLLRKAHYYLMRGEPERALRFVQRAQAVLARLD